MIDIGLGSRIATVPQPRIRSRRATLAPPAFAAIALAGVAMVPMGSNRPALWALWGAVVFGLLAWALMRAPEGALGRRIARAGLGTSFLLSLAVVAFALLQAAPLPPEARDTGAALLGALKLSTYIAFAALILLVATRESRIRRMHMALFLLIAAQAVYALAALTILGDSAPWGAKTAYPGMATGSYVNRNALAACLGMGLILGTGIALRRDGQPPAGLDRALMRAAMALCLGLILAALLATGSRAGLVSAGVGLVVLLGLSGVVPRGRLALVLAAGVAGLSYAYGGGVAARWLDLLAVPPDRIILWRQALGMLADRPMAGVGFDSFAPAFRSYHGPGLPVTVIWDHAHNSYIENWAELGLIVGSLPVLAAMLAARRLAAAQPDPRADMRRAIALAVLVQAGLHACVDFSFEIAANMLILLVIVMGGAAVPRSAATLVAGKGRRG